VTGGISAKALLKSVRLSLILSWINIRREMSTLIVQKDCFSGQSIWFRVAISISKSYLGRGPVSAMSTRTDNQEIRTRSSTRLLVSHISVYLWLVKNIVPTHVKTNPPDVLTQIIPACIVKSRPVYYIIA